MKYWVYELHNQKLQSREPQPKPERPVRFQKLFVANTQREAQAKAISWVDSLELPFKVFYVDLVGEFTEFPELPIGR